MILCGVRAGETGRFASPVRRLARVAGSRGASARARPGRGRSPCGMRFRNDETPDRARPHGGFPPGSGSAGCAASRASLTAGDEPTRRSAGDPSRLNRVASRRSSLRFGRNTPGIPPSRALSVGRLAGLGAHVGSTTGCWQPDVRGPDARTAVAATDSGPNAPEVVREDGPWQTGQALHDGLRQNVHPTTIYRPWIHHFEVTMSRCFHISNIIERSDLAQASQHARTEGLPGHPVAARGSSSPLLNEHCVARPAVRGGADQRSAFPCLHVAPPGGIVLLAPLLRGGADRRSAFS